MKNSYHQIIKRASFKVGMQDVLKVAPGVAAWGLTTGIAMSNGNMSVFEAVAMALFVFAGSSQLAATPLIAAGAPAWVIWITCACVNLRFVIFSAHLRQYLMHLPSVRRILIGYLTGDMAYALFIKNFPLPSQDEQRKGEQESYLFGAASIFWPSWMIPCVSGIFLAKTVPSAWGLGFAGVLALVGVTCSLIHSQLRFFAAFVAGCVAIVAYSLPFRLNILVAICTAVAASLYMQFIVQHYAKRKQYERTNS